MALTIEKLTQFMQVRLAARWGASAGLNRHAPATTSLDGHCLDAI